MAKLTKAQQDELNTLRKEAELAKALSWPNFPKPQPMKLPEDWDEMQHGWACNAHAGKVREQWRNRHAHYSSKPDDENEYSTGSQGSGGDMYVTEREAWLALFHETARLYAEKLAIILKHATEEQA